MQRTKIVITGGPSGGKTTLIEALKKEFLKKIIVVPEAASVLYKGGFPRIKTTSGHYHSQIAIYYTQKSLENMLAEDSTSELIVCDRGSLDAIAYWPNIDKDFFTTVNTSRAEELQRYDWVLHLDTASEQNYDNHNVIRTENHKEAVLLNEKIKLAWQDHPRRLIIGSESDFLSKMKNAIELITQILEGKSFDQIELKKL